MSAPTTRLAYTAQFDIWERAYESADGIRFQVKDEDAAINLRMLLHTARKIDRDDNRKLHEIGSKLFGQSIYDQHMVRYRSDDEGLWWVYIEPRRAAIGDIEELQPQEDLPWLAPSSLPKLISHTGSEPLPKRLELSYNAPTESSSSTPSTKPESELPIQGLRRL